ncbi:MAG TPA: hypothetical protein VHW69_12695 [Rhizomicrobium sp.]|jgi:hypothetical protein|nr:hypothetical protein [Rhizomicrobium sp.]
MAEALDFAKPTTPEEPDDLRCMLTLFSTTFSPAPAEHRNLQFQIRLMQSEYVSALAKIREDGGVWMNPEKDGSRYFIPWPPAAIKLEFLPENESAIS